MALSGKVMFDQLRAASKAGHGKVIDAGQWLLATIGREGYLVRLMMNLASEGGRGALQLSDARALALWKGAMEAVSEKNAAKLRKIATDFDEFEGGTSKKTQLPAIPKQASATVTQGASRPMPSTPQMGSSSLEAAKKAHPDLVDEIEKASKRWGDAVIRKGNPVSPTQVRLDALVAINKVQALVIFLDTVSDHYPGTAALRAAAKAKLAKMGQSTARKSTPKAEPAPRKSTPKVTVKMGKTQGGWKLLGYKSLAEAWAGVKAQAKAAGASAEMRKACDFRVPGGGGRETMNVILTSSATAPEAVARHIYFLLSAYYTSDVTAAALKKHIQDHMTACITKHVQLPAVTRAAVPVQRAATPPVVRAAAEAVIRDVISKAVVMTARGKATSGKRQVEFDLTLTRKGA